jgi:WNK lysine deficient protein kinase
MDSGRPLESRPRLPSYGSTEQSQYGVSRDYAISSLVVPNSEHIDLSKHSTEKIIELSPNKRYAKLNCILGKGAYKVVYKALDREEGYEVAWNGCQTSKAEYNELNDEIEILKRVRHPNIINFHDCWYNNTEIVFITELMTSGTLREYIHKLQILNLKIIKRWSRQILKGLLYLHSHVPPIIHRDIKCDNIFINGAHGEVKIGDLGIAKMKKGKNYTVIGTPEFMAPEMYDEKGYSEKVDVYAFGMCLLEMVTGEYPYSECKNAAQVYKRVTSGIKPECLDKVTEPQVLDIINNCLLPENERWSVQQLLETPFLLAEPEVLLISTNDQKNHLTMQVVFKGMDRLSVKFEFNVDTDTAEDVVNEMIEEQVIPERYQQLITSEINRILRELNKYAPGTEDGNDDSHHIWKRETAMEKELAAADERAIEAERRAFILEQQLAEKERKLENEKMLFNSSASALVDQDIPITQVLKKSSYNDIRDEVVEEPYSYKEEISNDRTIDDLVKDVCVNTNRNFDTANKWIQTLKSQDIVTVGDLRELHDEDWNGLGLTVLACRLLKNTIYGKS